MAGGILLLSFACGLLAFAYFLLYFSPLKIA